MKLSSIVVVGKNREIGFKNQLLWDLPEDMARFKKLTTGHTVIMGDRTFESIGSALPNRKNIVITLNKNYKAPNCEVVNSVEESVECAKKISDKNEAFVIGGGTIYKLFMPLIDRLYVTEVDDAPEADTFFPDYSDFTKVVSEEGVENDELRFVFRVLERNKP